MGKRLAGTLLAVVLLISFGAAYGEEYPVDVSGMKAAVLCSQDGQSIIEYNSAERLEVEVWGGCRCCWLPAIK